MKRRTHDLKVGDLVRLRDGGRILEVVDIHPEEDRIVGIWEGEDGKDRGGWFLIESLVKVDMD